MFLNECLYIINALFRSKRIHVNKTSASKECDISHYRYFLNYRFKFQSNFCNRCHDLLMMSMNLSDIAILRS